MVKGKFIKVLVCLTIGLTTFVESGIQSDAAWLQSSNGWTYNEGTYKATGWRSIDGSWYFFDSNGIMKTGWISDGGNWYYLNSSGEMKTGWLHDGGKCYYLSPSGVMLSGWITVDGEQYYMLADGSLFDGAKLSQKNTNKAKTIEMNSQEFNNIYRKYFKEYINNYRQSLGLNLLTTSEELEKSSLWKSQHMSEKNYFSHDYNGVNWDDLISNNTGINISAEIIYSGHGGNNSSSTQFNEEIIRCLAEKSFECWKNSPGHNAIMTGNYKSFGASYFIGSKDGYATGHFS